MLKKLLLAAVMALAPLSALAQSCVVPPTTNFGVQQVSVLSTPTQIVAMRCRNAVTITNTGSATVYVGGATVTTATGKSIVAGGSLTLQTTAAVYGIATATQTVDEVETF